MGWLDEGFRLRDCEVRPDDGTVRSPVGVSRLGPRPMAVLVTLAADAGKVFSREELMAEVWSGLVVSDETLSRCISDLRQALGDDPRSPRYIETLARRGYRLMEVPRALVDREVSVPATVTAEAPLPAEAVDQAPRHESRSPRRARRTVPWAAAAALAVVITVTAWLVTTQDLDERVLATALPLADNGIAVLPFVNLSDDPNLEYFSDGLSEELMHRLAMVDGLAVVARTSAFAFKDSNKDVRELGRELGVAYVLEGSVRRYDERLRIGAQLIDVRNGFHLFSRVYERPLDDVFAIQDHISSEVVNGLRLHIGAPDLRLPVAKAERSTDFASYEQYLRGRYYLSRRTPKDLEKAAHYFNESLRLEPDRSKTHSGLAAVYALMPYYSQSQPLEGMGMLARSHAMAAIRLDQRNAEAHSILGLVHMYSDFDWKKAEAAFALAYEFGRGDAHVVNLYGDYFYVTGDYAAAEEMEGVAARLEPLSAVHQLELGLVYAFRGQYEKAIRQAGLAIELNSDLSNGWWQLCRSYIFSGDLTSATRVLQENEAALGARYAARVRALIAAREGDLAVLRSIAAGEEAVYLETGGSPTILAFLFALAQDDEKAATYVDRAFNQRDAILVSPMYFFLPEDWNSSLVKLQEALSKPGLDELYELRRRQVAAGTGRVAEQSVFLQGGP